MQIKLYQATICYSNYTVQTPICESIDKVKMLLKHHNNYVCFQIDEIEIDVENKKVVEPYGIHYNTIERG